MKELSERKTKEFVQVLVVLKNNEIDLSNITHEIKLQDLLNNNKDGKRIMQELQKINAKITEKWSIGGRLSAQKKYILKLKEEIEKAGLILTEQEIKVILEKENKQELSERKTKEFVQVLVILKNKGIDLSNVSKKIKLQDLLNNNKDSKRIMQELQKVNAEITEKWPIGERLSVQKKNILRLKEEIEKVGIELTEEERKKILEKEDVQELQRGKSERVRKEFVQVLLVLKNNGIDLSEITQSSKIENLIKDNEKAKEIIEQLQKISEKITKDWQIGKRLSKQKNRNIIKLKEELENAEIELTDKERKNILEAENIKEIAVRVRKEFVQVLAVLKNNGIDLSKITRSSKLQDLIIDNDNGQTIIEELQEISREIKEDWPIGGKLCTQKSESRIKQLQEEIEKSGLELTDKERKNILEVENTKEMAARVRKEFVQVLVVLKNNRIDLSEITQSSKIENLIKDNEKAKEIIEQLQKISEEITKDWPIGTRLSTQKGKISKLQKEIENSGLKLTEQEIKVILEKENKQELSKRKTKEFVQVLVVLKNNGIDLSEIVIGKSTIDDLIKENSEEKQEQIINELQEVLEEITKDYPIGNRLEKQKGRSLAVLKKEIKETGLEEKLTDKERKKILEKTVQKKIKQTVVEQKNKGELGQNQQIEEEVFEETIRQAEQIQEAEASTR